MDDVRDPAAEAGGHEPPVTAGRADPRAGATGSTDRERARFEHEAAVLDLTDAAQAMARSQGALAAGLYASAERHRRMAAQLSEGGAPGDVPYDEVP